MIKIYHNPRCSTSRHALQIIEESGQPFETIAYLDTPLEREALRVLIQSAGLTVREAMRTKEEIYGSLGLADSTLNDNQLLDAIVAHPILLNRPFVTTAKGTRLCRPLTLIEEVL
ncbi:arsenate reductase (glutaredoxin) [Alcaligenaceae bacterium CGII-47]|nr:arsenate reductase (glutaredoxin) [Alcaligenaceae bacterium CGII-47]